MMDGASAIKEAIKELPLQERAVAVALKFIFDQIKTLASKEQEEIQQEHAKCLESFKALERQSSSIIKGESITQEQLKEGQKYFTQSEWAETQKVRQQQTPIKNYWLIIVANYYGDDQLNAIDKELFGHLVNAESDVGRSHLAVTFEFEKNAAIEAGKFTRRIILENGEAVRFEGDQPKWLQASKESKFGSILFTNSEGERCDTAIDLVGEFINELIPYSLQNYLGACEDGEEEQDGEDDQDDDDDDENSQEEAQ